MNLKLTCLTLGTLLVLGTGPLRAQDSASRWSVSASAGLGTDSLNMITNSGTSWTDFGAYSFDVGYRGMVAESGVPFRASIGVNYCPAGRSGIVSGPPVTSNPTLRALTGYYLAGDLFVNSRINENLFFIVGISLNKWEMDETVNRIKTYYSIRNPKFGGRFGVEFKISENLAFDAVFQMIEFGHNRTWLPDPSKGDGYLYAEGSRPWNPSWLQFGFKYTF